MGRGNGIALGRFLLWQSNWLYARWLPPSWGCAPSHLPPVGRYKRSPLQGNDTGHWRGSNDSQKIIVRIVSGDSPRLPPSWGCAPSHGRLSIKCNTFFPENFKRRFPVETFPRTVIQKCLNRGNVGFRNRPEIEALRVKEANHIVSILICSPLPRFMGLGKVDKRM